MRRNSSLSWVSPWKRTGLLERKASLPGVSGTCDTRIFMSFITVLSVGNRCIPRKSILGTATSWFIAVAKNKARNGYVRVKHTTCSQPEEGNYSTVRHLRYGTVPPNSPLQHPVSGPFPGSRQAGIQAPSVEERDAGTRDHSLTGNRVLQRRGIRCAAGIRQLDSVCLVRPLQCVTSKSVQKCNKFLDLRLGKPVVGYLRIAREVFRPSQPPRLRALSACGASGLEILFSSLSVELSIVQDLSSPSDLRVPHPSEHLEGLRNSRLHLGTYPLPTWGSDVERKDCSTWNTPIQRSNGREHSPPAL